MSIVTSNGALKAIYRHGRMTRFRLTQVRARASKIDDLRRLASGRSAGRVKPM